MYYYKSNGGIAATQKPVSGAVEISEEEYANIKANLIPETLTAEEAERSRPLTLEEVTRMVVAQTVNSLNPDDQTALRMVEFYPEWAKGTDYRYGYKVQYGWTLYRCLSDHTSQEGWAPDAAPSLWAEVIVSDDGSPLPWKQPNSTNAYKTGDMVTYDGATWVSTVDGNVWEPGIYGWAKKEETKWK